MELARKSPGKLLVDLYTVACQIRFYNCVCQEGVVNRFLSYSEVTTPNI